MELLFHEQTSGAFVSFIDEIDLASGCCAEAGTDELGSRSLLLRSSPRSMRRFLWPCDSTDGCTQRRGCGWLAKAQATARVDVPTTQKSRRKVSGADRRETGFFFAVWDPGLFDPALVMT